LDESKISLRSANEEDDEPSLLYKTAERNSGGLNESTLDKGDSSLSDDI
jgi:hypothetical protein